MFVVVQVATFHIVHLLHMVQTSWICSCLRLCASAQREFEKHPGTKGHFLLNNEAVFRISNWNVLLSNWTQTIFSLFALCFGYCNYCVLMRVIIDCCSLHMKINSLCIMTSPTQAVSHPEPPTPPSLHHPLPELLYTTVHSSYPSICAHQWWFFTAQGFPHNLRDYP